MAEMVLSPATGHCDSPNDSPTRGFSGVLDPNDSASGDRQVRISLIWEYSPMQFLQGRFGLRSYDGIPTIDFQNRDIFFAELHGYF